MPTLTIHDRTATGKSVGTFTIDLPARITVRELIRTRVREEVARHNLQVSVPFRGLVTPTEVESALNPQRPSTPRRIDWEAQAEVALDAFGRNGFFVLVDRRQVTSLDKEVDVASTGDVAFIRLVPLIGG